MTHPEPDRTIRRVLLELLKEKAVELGVLGDGQPSKRQCFNLLNPMERNEGFVGELKSQAGLRGSNIPQRVYDRVISEVHAELVADGIVIPFGVNGPPAGDAGQLPIAFTRRGIDWAEGECRIRTNPNEILEAVQEVHNDHPDTVTPGCVALVQEAVDCVEKRCFRAAVVLVGVAAEEGTTQLMECLCNLTGYTNDNTEGWKDLNNRSLGFARRWAGARKVLGAVKERIKNQLKGPRPDWWSLWEGLPESLVPLAEAVRISRNTAAHDADHKFTYLEAAALLCGLPHQLRWIAEIQNHIQNPRDGVKPSK